MSDNPQTHLYINGVWRDGPKERLSILNPASDEIIGTVADAGRDTCHPSRGCFSISRTVAIWPQSCVRLSTMYSVSGENQNESRAYCVIPATR
jgi:hypothetical protein